MKPIDKAEAPHYLWGDGCDGWRLLSGADMSVILERMPPGTAEERHYHTQTRQFFFVLSGTLTLDVAGENVLLSAGTGMEIPPCTSHQARNQQADAIEFLVISHPGNSRSDRVPS